MPVWAEVAMRIHAWQKKTRQIPTNVTVLLPFAQLIAPLRQAWGALLGNGLLVRMETTQTWAARLGGFHHAGAGPTGDLVVDTLQARSLLQNWILDREEAGRDFAAALADTLALMAAELMHAVGELPPAQRGTYWERAIQIAQRPQPGVAGVEAALAPIAVAWAQATEGWTSDVLFAAADRAANTASSGLVVIQAGGVDTLASQLFHLWPQERRLWIDLDVVDIVSEVSKSGKALSRETDIAHSAALEVPSLSKNFEAPKTATNSADAVLMEIARRQPPLWQIAADGEDEAERAAAHVLALLNAGIAPVALCSQDRPIARRVRALLSRQQVPLADETGWTLSTTRSASLVMALARCAQWDATSDVMLDVLKALPPEIGFTHGLDALEVGLRQAGLPQWPTVPLRHWPVPAQAMLQRVNALAKALRGSGARTLMEHIQALTDALKTCGGWQVLERDEAGREVLQTLHCEEMIFVREGNPNNSGVEQSTLSHFARQAQDIRMGYADFVHWISRTLETVTFIPPTPLAAQVVITPLARVMLRPFAAIVIPGCDQSRLTALPALPGFWRDADRITLGLANRERWWQRLQAQWAQALRLPRAMLIWRNAEDGQPLTAATLVQRVLPAGIFGESAQSDSHNQETWDAERPNRVLAPAPTQPSAPRPAQQLPVAQLSASGYQKLRNCPYQFYALQLLKLREQDELESKPTRRDYGNWLHAVLLEFHTERAAHAHSGFDADRKLLEHCAHNQAKAYDAAAVFLWMVRWPKVAEAYLKWLHTYEQDGGRFVQAEVSMRHLLMPGLMLQGRIDRLDQQCDAPVLIDYKTERREYTDKRVSDALEDVQLPFYALLVDGEITAPGTRTRSVSNADRARAFYLSLDEREADVQTFSVNDLAQEKEMLRQGIVSDVTRLHAGAIARPIGQAQACTYCAAIGLCRKPFWTDDALPPTAPPGLTGGKINREEIEGDVSNAGEHDSRASHANENHAGGLTHE